MDILAFLQFIINKLLLMQLKVFLLEVSDFRNIGYFFLNVSNRCLMLIYLLKYFM